MAKDKKLPSFIKNNKNDDKEASDGKKKLPNFMKKDKKSDTSDDKENFKKLPPFMKNKEKSTKESDNEEKKDVKGEKDKKKIPSFMQKGGDNKAPSDDNADSKEKDKNPDKKVPPFMQKKGTDKDDKSQPKSNKGDVSRGGKNPEISDPVKVNFDPEVDTNINEQEIIEIIAQHPDLFSDEILEEYLPEVLSVAQRMKRRQQVRRFKAKMQMARKRAMKRRATAARIKMRASKTARQNMKKKLAGGRSPTKLTYSERARVERLATRRKGAIIRQTRRLIIKKRAQERMRLSRHK